MLLDLRSGQWSKLADGPVGYPAWTGDGSWLHYRREEPDGGFCRIDPTTRREERVASLGGLPLAGGAWGAWSGVSPEGAPLVLRAGRAAFFSFSFGGPRRAQRGASVRVESSEAADRKTSL
jgi:hypothetical protein